MHEQRGWLAYEAYVMLDSGDVDPRFIQHKDRWRQLFKLFFNGFGDKSPDDSFDAGD